MKLFYPGRSLLAQLAAVFLIISNVAKSQGTANFSFNSIPYSDPDFIAPGRGAEQWHNGSARINYPTESNNLESPDLYYRFEWARLEGATQGSYNWSYFDNLINSAINKGQKFSFGIMTHYSDGGYASYDGGTSSYPQYLHNLMQAEATNSRDWLSGNRVWVPNWNSPNYLGRLRALHVALYDHIMTGSYTPSSGPHAGKRINYRDVIYCIDIRGYGNWGEWHSGEICDFNAYPTGRQPTTATFKEIIDLHTEVFDRWPLVMMVAGYDGGYTGISLFGVPAEVSYYALTARNKWGAVGYRRDQWGATDTYLSRLMATNNQTYNGSLPFKTYILEKYKYAPVTGEPMPASLDMSDLENQVNLYHATSIGNGNWGAQPSSSTVKDNIRKAFKRTGYRIELTGGSATATSSNFTVNLNWRNVGVAPTYEDWKVTYELRNGSTVVWSGVSSFKPKLFLPSPTATTATDAFNRSGIPQGTYSLHVIVKDSTGYRQPLPLAVQGRASDGSYVLTNSITIPSASGGNQVPVANAGANQTVTLPTNTANLNGSASSDPDGSISTYLWQQVSGPSTSTLSATNTANITVSNLQAGVYTFRLTVTDNGNATGTATVTVTVNDAVANQAPVANAGPNRTITLPTNSTSLTGSGTDADGTIASYNWQQVSGPSASTLSATNTATITVSNLQAGVYTYRLTVTDNDDESATATVTVTVNAPANQAPVANAGSNRSITLPTSSTTLNGSSSSDADGTITTYGWTQVSGPSTATFSATNTASVGVSDLQAGIYRFRLTVTDNDNATDTDEVTVTVNNAVANQNPIANAGSNRTITLPTSSTTLNGSGSSDADGTIASYLWEQVNGPSTSTLSATTTASITVSNLQAGVYSYRLTVTDNDNATSFDVVTVTVNAPANQVPVANAGSNRAITLPTNSTTLNGSASSDPDGTITSYLWQQVSGPTTATLSATNTASINVSDLQAGVYSFRLTVTDNDNATGTDVVSVTVNNAAANQAPIASAGPNRTITLPTNTTTLNGSGSSDADGTINVYLWQQVSGPSTSTLSATNTANITVSNLQAGVYTFRLTVTDDDNGTDNDLVSVTVNPAPNQAPVANAGPNRTITLPTNSVTLNGAASSDPDGTIATYRWQQVNGPGTSTLSATNTASITVSNLQAGVYSYRLTVTDNRNASSSDIVTVTVNPAVNQAPLANAGANRSITLPANSTTLNGGASSDADGTIVAYVWQQVSGPSAATMSSTTTAAINLTNLQAGVYVFRLSVRDDDNATDTDDVTVTVNRPVIQAPTANAGADRVITLPANSTSLNGSGSSDPDGNIVAYAWQQVSGPSTATLSSANTAATNVSNLRAGVYVFRLTVRDNDNATDTDEVTITVNVASNQAPVANAGTDRVLTLPANSTTLNGSGSTDADGTIVAYLWQQLSGPSTATLSSPNTAATNVSNLQAGVYTFRLTVRDDDNATATDQVTITINTAANQGPVANAGANRVISLPTNSTSLSGAASSDPDGTIISYQWQQVSGPSASTMSATTGVSINVSNLRVGVYTYRLTVRDNDNATATASVTVTVNNAANKAPVAKAGQDQVIVVTSNTTTLNASESADPDGTITSYAWQQVSGPSASTMSANSGVSITVSDLEIGEYVYRVTVRDNMNATASAMVKVTVIDNFRNYDKPVVLYPNPARDIVNIGLLNDKAERAELSVYDLSGKMVIPPVIVNKPTGAYTTTIDVTRLKPGTYVVQIASFGKKKYTTKFLKL